MVPILTGVSDTIVDDDDMVPHSCIDPTRVAGWFEEGRDLTETDQRFWSDLYHSLVTLVSVALPLIIIPPTLMVAIVRACLHGHCCQVTIDQSQHRTQSLN